MNKFEQEVSKININERCIQSDCGEFRNSPLNTCFFGVPSNELYGRISLETVPENIPEICFLMGSGQEVLVEAFIRSEQCQTVNHLSIGCSSYSKAGKEVFPLDYKKAISVLEGANCPALKTLSLGSWHLFHNASCAYGRLGDITPTLRNFSHLEELFIYGNFELTEAITFPSLKGITVLLEDEMTGMGGGPISNATLCNLMHSSFPKLKELFFDLDCNKNDSNYTFPEVFLKGDLLPQLSNLEITGGFFAGEKEKLNASPLCERVKVKYLDDMV